MNKDYVNSIICHSSVAIMDYLNYKKKHPEIKGYILLQEYPGCNKKIGDFEPYTSGEFSKYPNIWKPVYHKEIEREKKLNQLLGE